MEKLEAIRERIIYLCEEKLAYNGFDLSYRTDFDDIELAYKILAKKAYPTTALIKNIIIKLGIRADWLLANEPLTNKIFYSRPLSYELKESEQKILDFIKSRKIERGIFVFEDLTQAEEPKAALILEKNDVFEIVWVANLFDTITKEGRTLLGATHRLTQQHRYKKFNLFIRDCSPVVFDEIISRKFHIRNVLLKNSPNVLINQGAIIKSMLELYSSNELEMQYAHQERNKLSKELSENINHTSFQIGCIIDYYERYGEIL
ncbi:hypothetical protein OFO01_07000 [Campylobacter sp. JMF_01 NE2]|nr:hypothetical protein [Campylobacter sp. JMF_03 NE3]MDA3053290.1 hypothetical protein [Campylobacter sp. JMF_03 NE3]MDA3067527.1 hypothetical protein [Campylobacter sp. JMF_01 NE2]